MCRSLEQLQLKAKVELMPEEQRWRPSRSKQLINGEESQQDMSLPKARPAAQVAWQENKATLA